MSAGTPNATRWMASKEDITERASPGVMESIELRTASIHSRDRRIVSHFSPPTEALPPNIPAASAWPSIAIADALTSSALPQAGVEGDCAHCLSCIVISVI